VTASEDIAQGYLEALSGRDIDKMRPLLHDDFVLESPYNLTGTNLAGESDSGDAWAGKEKACQKFEQAFRNMVDMTIRDVDISPTTDPDVVFAELRGDMTMATGKPYKNLYVLRFDIVDGKIRKVTEYRNPVTAAIAFGRPLPSSPAS
jgi:ketosteroid isomerase-like protein